MTVQKQGRGVRALALLLAVLTLFSVFPLTASAAQENGYHDPADHWLPSNNRTNELDANAVVTHETFLCYSCDRYTGFTVWRTPEYARGGVTAMSRNVKYSDGTCVDGKTAGVILDGIPGKDARYTGSHWTKACCDTCGTLNANMDPRRYCYSKDVYWLYDCAAEFTQELPGTASYACEDSAYHQKSTTSGTYCGFCYGTRKETGSTLERHDLERTVTPQPGHQRFVVRDFCTLCGYERSEYVGAKAVVADYYGVVDGQPHTLTVSDLSESGVHASIRYGHSADACNLTTAPSYTEEGQYTVYYEITYTCQGEEMTENGVAYVWLRDEAPDADGGADGPCGGDNHHFTKLETVPPTCLGLGYTRYLCPDCGKVEKRDYTAALGHAWQSIVIREATCEADGKVLEVCQRCGETNVVSTPKGEHRYETHHVAATCTMPGHTVRECTVCGDRHITDLTAALPHKYQAQTIPTGCEGGGRTIHRCEGCGSSFVTDYTAPMGHSWDEGRAVTVPTCTGEGVTEYRCTRCGFHRLEAASPAGHRESGWIIDKEPTAFDEGRRHKECEHCGAVLEQETLDKLGNTGDTDGNGEADIGGYLVIVTDANTGNPVANASVVLNRDSTFSIRLPHRRLLSSEARTTVTVLLKKDRSPLPGLGVTVTDRESNRSAGRTNVRGQLTVPAASGSTGGNTTVGGKDDADEKLTLTVKVSDYESGRTISGVVVTIGRDGHVTVRLPRREKMDANNRILVTITDNRKRPQAGIEVTVKDDLGQTAGGETDRDGELVVPAGKERHSAYIVGYPDGTFGPSRTMTRAEAAAIFARLLAEKKAEKLPTTGYTPFRDVSVYSWYSGYVQYLGGYGIVLGRTAASFAPDAPVTRAEFTAMAVRFLAAYGAEKTAASNAYFFYDVAASDWAASYIQEAALHGWVIGYGDGTFRGETAISRAEAVTLLNRLLNREADEAYIEKNLRNLYTFVDMSKYHWAYLAVVEAANAHTAKTSNPETWSK